MGKKKHVDYDFLIQKLSIFLGISVAFVSSIVGPLSSGHFSILSFIVTFFISTVISVLIGVFVPFGRIVRKITRNFRDFSLKKRALVSLIYDLIFTPFTGTMMVIMAYNNVSKHGAPVTFLSMFIRSVCMIVIIGYVVIFILFPVYCKMLKIKK